MTVTVPSGLCRSWSEAAALPPSASYRALAHAYFRTMAPSPLRASLRQALKPESILAHLDAEPVFSLDAPPAMPAPLSGQRLEWQWLDPGSRCAGTAGPAGRPRKAAACAPGCRAASF